MRGTYASDSLAEAIPPPTVSNKCFDSLRKNYDKKQGGFGKAPKFPQPGKLFVNELICLDCFNTNEWLFRH